MFNHVLNIYKLLRIWAHKYSCLTNQFIKPLTKARKILKSFLIANIIMEDIHVHVSRILLEKPLASSELNIAQPSVPLDYKRHDRLSAVAAGGNSKKFFGKEYIPLPRLRI